MSEAMQQDTSRPGSKTSPEDASSTTNSYLLAREAMGLDKFCNIQNVTSLDQVRRSMAQLPGSTSKLTTMNNGCQVILQRFNQKKLTGKFQAYFAFCFWGIVSPPASTSGKKKETRETLSLQMKSMSGCEPFGCDLNDDIEQLQRERGEGGKC
jgi:hypothetical protein